MTVGLSTTNVANGWLNTIRGGGAGTSFTAPAAIYLKLHTGDPGAAGANNASAVTTRQAATLGAASSGAVALTNSPAFSMTATETIADVSVWDSPSAGNLLWTAALTTAKSVVSGDTLTFTTLGVSLSPLAA
jgi:hypothetical protein